MRHFATESGKSKGQFYTPSEVSRVIAKVIGISPANTVAATTAYDPTCGSGSLLLKVAAQAGKHITLEGQEKDVTTAGLARMNMILHDFPTANILSGNTLAAPKFKDGERLRTYDYVVANPPFSDKTWSTGLIPAQRPLPALRLGRAAREAGGLRLPAPHHPLDEEHGQRGLHPAPRRTLPRQCRGRLSAGSSSAPATSRGSSACPPTSFTAPVSPPASWCSTRKMPPPARASS